MQLRAGDENGTQVLEANRSRGPGSVSQQFNQILKPDQWKRLIQRLGEIDNPTVPTSPSDAALPAGKHKSERKKSDRKRASSAHIGE